MIKVLINDLSRLFLGEFSEATGLINTYFGNAS
jgi:hypothetical protein